MVNFAASGSLEQLRANSKLRSPDKKQVLQNSLTRYGILSREKRRELFALDCPDQLEWHNWQPGTEYNKNFFLKNVSTKTIQIRYKQTASKAFSMAFPEPIKIRAGMSCPLQVIFRPLKLQQYSDHIEIYVDDVASFIVLVEAHTPATSIHIPQSLAFGFVPCKELQQQQLTLHNTGDVQVDVSWALDAPFSISPVTASVAPATISTFTVSFLPQEAGSFMGNATCSVAGDGPQVVCQVSGVAKFPYLSLEQPVLDFGDVVVGNVVEKTIRFGNHSLVPANFTVVHDSPAAADGVFNVTPASGALGPDEFSTLKLVYTPKHFGTFSCETFTLSTAGGNRLTLTLKGTAAAPQVTFSARVLNFGSVLCDTPSSRVLYLQNNSNVPVNYDFQVDANDMFSFSKPQGCIVPGLTTHVTVTFKSTSPANYWKRIPCMIQNADPICVDLVATSYNDKARPPPLELRHIHDYIKRVEGGGPPVDQEVMNVGSAAPSPVPSVHEVNISTGQHEQADQIDGNADAVVGGDGGPVSARGTGGMMGHTASMLTAPLLGPDSWQVLFDGQDPCKALAVDTDMLQFAPCSRLTAAEYQAVTVTNHTTTKVTAWIHVPPWRDPGSGQLVNVFQSFPETADIKPGCSTVFRVAFRPSRDAAHVCQVLSLCAHMKSMRNFRLVTDTQMVPPWSIPILAAGNTFQHTNPEFSPKINISHKAIAFPACRQGYAVHQVLTLVNYGDTPASFNFTNVKSLAPHFTIRPAMGVVAPKSHCLIGIQFKAATTKPVESRAVLMLNGVSVATSEIVLRACGHHPALIVDASGSQGKKAGDPGQGTGSTGHAASSLFFRPTCVGAAASRAVVLKNPSRVPIMFQWNLPAKLEGVVEVSPMTGLLRGLESLPLSWSFTPRKEKVYEASATCALLPVDSHDAAASHPEVDNIAVKLRIVGEGTAGALTVEPHDIQFGDVRVGHPIKKTVKLVNQSDGLLRYALEFHPVADDHDDDHGQQGSSAETHDYSKVPADQEQNLPVEFLITGVTPDTLQREELWVDESDGTIVSRAVKEVTLTLYPRYRKQYKFVLRCKSAAVPPVVTRPSSGTGPGVARLPPLMKQPSISAMGGLEMRTSITAAAMSTQHAQQQPQQHIPLGDSAVMVECPVTANATFPRLLITDVFMDGKSKSALWSNQGINDVNTELASCVSTAELELEKMEHKGSLTTDRACAALQAYRVDLGCVFQDAAPPTLHVRVHNPTPLPVTWELQNYENPDLELENWVEPGRPRNDRERARDFVTQNQIFKALPKRGQLEPGASETLVLQYRTAFVGKHVLPMFLRVIDGKRMHFELVGKTVAQDDAIQRLALPKALRTFTLPATPIGTTSPPLHAYPLINAGPGELQYRLDTSPLDTLRCDNHDYSVVQLCSNAEGSIPENGDALLLWKFSPLEAKVYTVDIPVHLADGTCEVIRLQGRGYHTSNPSIPPPLKEEGDRVSASWLGFSNNPSPDLAAARLVMFSEDDISFGATLPQGVARRVVVLTNTSSYPVLYTWDLGAVADRESLAGGLLDLDAPEGRLEPGEHALVRLTFTAPRTALLLASTIRCIVGVDEDAVFATVHQALAEEEEETAARAIEVTETGSLIEEVIEQHPVHSGGVFLRSSRRKDMVTRLPVHLGMTECILRRLGKLGQQWSQTLSQYTRSAHRSKEINLDLPPPQTTAITLSAAVLERCHLGIDQGSCPFVPIDQAEQVRQQVEQCAWVPPTVVPFFRKPGNQQEHEGAGLTDQGSATTNGQEQQNGSMEEDDAGKGDTALEQETSPEWPSMQPTASQPARQEASLQEPHLPHAQPAGSDTSMDMHDAPPAQEGSDHGIVDTTFAGGIPDAAGADNNYNVLGTAEDPGIRFHVLEPVPEASMEGQVSAVFGTESKTDLDDDQQEQQYSLDNGDERLEAGDKQDRASGASVDNCVDLRDLPLVPAPGPHAMSRQHQIRCQSPSGSSPTSSGQAKQVAAQILLNLLQEVLDPAIDADVAASLQNMHEQPMPAYVQLAADAHKAYPVSAPALQKSSKSSSTAATTFGLGRDAAAGMSQASGMALDQQEGALGDGPAQQSGGADSDGVTKEDDGAGGLQAVLRDPAFQQLAEYVMESTVMSLLEESVAGEWEPSSQLA